MMMLVKLAALVLAVAGVVAAGLVWRARRCGSCGCGARDLKREDDTGIEQL